MQIRGWPMLPKALTKMNDDKEKGKILLCKTSDPEDFFSLRGWAIRCFANKIDEMLDDPKKLVRCVGQVSAFT